MEFTRRNFVKGIAGTAIAGSALGMAGIAAAEEATEGVVIPETIDQTMDCDIVVVGAGIAGLAATVQAALDGHSVIALEKLSFLGATGGAVEGQFGVQSKMQLEAGIDFTVADVVEHEMSQGQFRNSGAQWVDFCEHTAGNIEWEIENGVVFEKVDDYFGTCTLATFHWYKNHNASEGFIEPMSARAAELGAQILMETAATALIIDEQGIVCGVYAQDKQGTIQINAKAVILASGGVGGDPELIK